MPVYSPGVPELPSIVSYKTCMCTVRTYDTTPSQGPVLPVAFNLMNTYTYTPARTSTIPPIPHLPTTCTNSHDITLITTCAKSNILSRRAFFCCLSPSDISITSAQMIYAFCMSALNSTSAVWFPVSSSPWPSEGHVRD